MNALDLTYVPDKVVVDVQAEIAPATEDEDSMQIRLHADDCWHRHAVGNRVTACGLPIRPSAAVMFMAGYDVRAVEYSGALCTECFTPFELHLAAEANRKDKEL